MYCTPFRLIDCRLVQFWNAAAPIVLHVSGKDTEVRLLHPAKAFGPMVCNCELFANWIDVKVDSPVAGVMEGGVTVAAAAA